MITFPLLDAMCRGVIPFCTEKHMHLHRRTLQEPSVVMEIKTAARMIILPTFGVKLTLAPLLSSS